MALLPIVTSMPPGTTIKGEGFYVELFLYVPSPWSSSTKRNPIIYWDRDVQLNDKIVMADANDHCGEILMFYKKFCP